MAACEGGPSCDESLYTVMGSMNGDYGLMGCDILDAIYEGTPDNNFFRGSKSNFQAKSGYLFTLVSNGIQVNSAYKTLRDGNNTNTW